MHLKNHLGKIVKTRSQTHYFSDDYESVEHKKYLKS